MQTTFPISSRYAALSVASCGVRLGWLFTILTTWLGVFGARAQDLEVGRVESCPRCTIRFQIVATIGNQNDPDEFTERGEMVGLRSGFLVPAATADHLILHDSVGRFQRTIGRNGGGPGEFKRITRLWIGPGDSIFVFDGGRHRLSVWTPALNFAREQSLSIEPTMMVGLRTGKAVVTATMAGAKRRLYLVDQAGLTPFGPDIVVDPKRLWDLERNIFPARKGTIWGTYWNQYRIEAVDEFGKVRKTIRSNPDWFLPMESPALNQDFLGQKRPKPRIIAVQDDGQRRLWVLLGVPSPDWTPTTAAQMDSLNAKRLPASTILYTRRHSIVEVIDLDTGKLIRSERLPRWTLGFLGPGVIAAARYDDDGVMIIDAIRVSLAEPKRR